MSRTDNTDLYYIQQQDQNLPARFTGAYPVMRSPNGWLIDRRETPDKYLEMPLSGVFLHKFKINGVEYAVLSVVVAYNPGDPSDRCLVYYGGIKSYKSRKRNRKMDHRERRAQERHFCHRAKRVLDVDDIAMHDRQFAFRSGVSDELDYDLEFDRYWSDGDVDWDVYDAASDYDDFDERDSFFDFDEYDRYYNPLFDTDYRYYDDFDPLDCIDSDPRLYSRYEDYIQPDPEQQKVKQIEQCYDERDAIRMQDSMY